MASPKHSKNSKRYPRPRKKPTNLKITRKMAASAVEPQGFGIAEFELQLREAVKGNPLAQYGLDMSQISDPNRYRSPVQLSNEMPPSAYERGKRYYAGTYTPRIDRLDIFDATAKTISHELAHRGVKLLEDEGVEALPYSNFFSKGKGSVGHGDWEEIIIRYFDLLNFGNLPKGAAPPFTHKGTVHETGQERAFIQKTLNSYNRSRPLASPEELKRRADGFLKHFRNVIERHKERLNMTADERLLEDV